MNELLSANQYKYLELHWTTPSKCNIHDRGTTRELKLPSGKKGWGLRVKNYHHRSNLDELRDKSEDGQVEKKERPRLLQLLGVKRAKFVPKECNKYESFKDLLKYLERHGGGVREFISLLCTVDESQRVKSLDRKHFFSFGNIIPGDFGCSESMVYQCRGLSDNDNPLAVFDAEIEKGKRNNKPCWLRNGKHGAILNCMPLPQWPPLRNGKYGAILSLQKNDERLFSPQIDGNVCKRLCSRGKCLSNPNLFLRDEQSGTREAGTFDDDESNSLGYEPISSMEEWSGKEEKLY